MASYDTNIFCYFTYRFGATPSEALPNLLRQIYSCASRALSKMSLTDKGFNLGIGPACSVDGCPGKRKTAALSKATVKFVQVIQSHHPTRAQGNIVFVVVVVVVVCVNELYNLFLDHNLCEMRGPLPCWGRPGVHVIDLSVHFRHLNKVVSHYSQCQNQIMTPESKIGCCPQHSILRDWVPHEPAI